MSAPATLTASELKILRGLDTLTSKATTREVIRKWAKLSHRGVSIVVNRMADRRLIARGPASDQWQITFAGMQALKHADEVAK